MVSINWTVLAVQDLEDIKDYISQDSIKYAEIVVRKLYNSVSILKSNPRIGRIVPELDNEIIREIVQPTYRIIYKIVDTSRIDILTVHHTSRLISNNPSAFI